MSRRNSDVDGSTLVLGCIGIIILVLAVMGLMAAALIYAVNGLFGLELAYSLNNLFYAYIIIALLNGGTAYSSSKK
jgi:hypothetical protein